MQAYRCLIIDNSESSALLLKEYLTELSIIGQFTLCYTYAEAATALLSNSYDLIFLEIELNEQNGLDLLKLMPALPPVIVVSAQSQYAVDCFDLNVADFLQKPFGKTRLFRGVYRAMNISADKESIIVEQTIFLKVGRRLQRFRFDQIDYIEAYGIYSKVYFQGHFDVVNEPIMNLENRLPNLYFRRVHKSYIVNLERITSYNHTNFFIGDVKIPLGTSYRDHVPNIYQLLG
ncbi:LytR/AlgR family response regulator transcription factor [Fibrella aquatica]|jgi:DNA-binding LytR/AlgR family response regulator|uniref:LytR/AlgR family response regulator transcription factor n=1 Tax=Fibrella aquatica TaxID=3242487 RepID=UPI0035218297